MARFLLILAAWIGLATPSAAAPLEAYGRLPLIEAISLSPDGQRVAMITAPSEQRMVVVKDLASGKTLNAVGAGDTKVRGLQWVDAQHVLITASTTTTIEGITAPFAEYSFVLDYNLATNKVTRLLKDVRYALDLVVQTPETRVIDGKPTAILAGIRFVERRGQVALFQVDLTTGGSRVLEPGFQNSGRWVVSEAGQPLAVSEYESAKSQWRLKTRTKGGWKLVTEVAAPTEAPTLIGLGRTDGSVLVSTFADGVTAYREIGASAGGWAEPFVSGESETPIYDRATHRLVGFYRLNGDKDVYAFFDPQNQKAWNAAQAAYPGARVTLVSASDDRNRLIVLVDSPTTGPAYALVDLKARAANWIGPQYAGLKPGDLGLVRPVRFKARDGLELTGYLTLPPGREPKNLPLVVFPHGGPAARDTPGFDWWAQAMASRGYAVLQVNFRGSAGFGWAFLSKGFGEWGRKMQTDLSDGVRYLASEGIVDPKRVCITGASYGGYAALAGAAFDKGVYRCAAAVAAPADLRKLVAFSRNQSGVGALRYWTRFMGAENLGDPALQVISPSEHVDKIDIPVLLVHGKDDTIVPLSQSNLMADALKRAGKPVELVVMPGEDHWLTSGDTRLQTLQAVVAFLEKHNPPT